MESKLLSEALAAASGAAKDAAATPAGTGAAGAVVQRFQALMQQTSPAPNIAKPTAVNAAERSVVDRYTDEVPTASLGQRGASLPPELEAVGKGLSDTLKLAITGPAKLTEMKITDPHIAQLRDGMLDAIKFQGSMVHLNMTMKSVELSAQGFQALYKMQG
jgi:hypothetical protein